MEPLLWTDLEVEVEHEGDDAEPNGEAHDAAVAARQLLLKRALVLQGLLHLFEGGLRVHLRVSHVVPDPVQCLPLLVN